jgi:DNA-directed RNA polymerase specialized sigma24 family protein
MNSTKDVIQNRIRPLREGNIRGVLDAFSPDAIFLTPTGVLKGTEKSQMSVVPNRLQEDSAVFDVRFWRSYRMLRFIACRVLGGPKHANKAIENCWHTASRRAPHFDHEGEFRSWLLRVLIEEALALLRDDQQTPKPDVLPEPLPVEVFSGNYVHSVSNIDGAFQTKELR